MQAALLPRVQHFAVLDADQRVISWGTMPEADAWMLDGLADHVAISPADAIRLAEGGRLQLADGAMVDQVVPPALAPADQVRARRDALLRATDATVHLHQLPDYPATRVQRRALLAYRKALRDLPRQPGFPDRIDWPTPPAA